MSTLEGLKEIIARVTHGSESDIEMGTAMKDVKADSLHWVQIMVAVEGDFGIEMDIDAMKEFTTIGDFVNYIDSAGS